MCVHLCQMVKMNTTDKELCVMPGDVFKLSATDSIFCVNAMSATDSRFCVNVMRATDSGFCMYTRCMK